MADGNLSVDTGSQATWGSGDYARIGNLWLLVSESLCETVGVRPGERVLDVATGTGNTALAARRRFGVVTGVDYVPGLLDHARTRARADGLDIAFEVGDARRLPYADGAFDLAVSTFGVMYVPDQRRAADELVRVVRPGGRIGLASWSPDGFIGRMLDLVDKHTSAPADAAKPALWGDEDRLRELFGSRAASVTAGVRHWTARLPSPEELIAYFGAYFGPLNRAFAALDEAGAEALTGDLAALIAELNTADDGTAVVPSAYLEAVVVTAAS